MDGNSEAPIFTLNQNPYSEITMNFFSNDTAISPICVSDSLQASVCQLFLMSRLRFGTQKHIEPDFEASDLFVIKKVETEIGEMFVSFFMDEYSNNPHIDEQIQLGIIAPALLASGEAEYIFHVSKAYHSIRDEEGMTEPKEACTGLFIDEDGAQLVFMATVDDCKKFACQKFQIDEWLKGPCDEPPELIEGVDITKLGQPNKKDSLWSFMSTKNMYCEQIEIINKGIRIAKQKADKIKEEIKAEEMEMEKNTLWN